MQATPPQMAAVLLPLLMDMLKFGVTGYRVGKSIEGAFDEAAEKIKQIAQQPPQQPQVPPEVQIEQMKLQADAQLEQMRQQMKMQELQYLDQFNRYKAQLDSSTRIMVAEIGAKAQVDKVREAEEAANTEVAIVLGQA
jgi:hypothetical protein